MQDAILNGDLAPGELLDEHRLEERFGVPPMVLHDALTALTAEGLLVRGSDGGFRVTDPDPATVGDALRTIGVLMGGVVRHTVPVLSDAGRTILCEFVARAGDSIRRQDARGHAQVALELYAALLKQCPNPVLTHLSRTSLVPLSYHYLVSIDRRELDWVKIAHSWAELGTSFHDGDQIRGELAIEALHGLPEDKPGT